MRSYFGNINRGTSPVAIFAGAVVQPRGFGVPIAGQRGFGAPVAQNRGFGFPTADRRGFGGSYSGYHPCIGNFSADSPEEMAGILAEADARCAQNSQNQPVNPTSGGGGSSIFTDLMNGIGKIADVAGGVVNKFKTGDARTTTPTPPLPNLPPGYYDTSSSGLPSWVLPAGLGVAALGVVAFMATRKGK